MALTTYLYDLYEADGKTPVCRRQTKAEVILFLGENISLKPYADGNRLLRGRYRVKRSGKTAVTSYVSDSLLAEFEAECRKFRKLEWVEEGGFNLAEAWRKWKEEQKKKNDGGGRNERRSDH